MKGILKQNMEMLFESKDLYIFVCNLDSIGVPFNMTVFQYALDIYFEKQNAKKASQQSTSTSINQAINEKSTVKYINQLIENLGIPISTEFLV